MAEVATRVHIRWMIRADMPAVLRIESESFDFPWDEQTFIEHLRQRNCIGMVAESDGGHVVGYVVYELHKKRLDLLNIAVAREHRRHGVGTQMLAKLASKLNDQRRDRITLEVRETNLGAQLFFKQVGFRATAVLHGVYHDWQTAEDAYMMQFFLRDI